MSVGPRDHLLGRLVGKYRVEAVLGRGGMGTVYKAVHTEIGARVALKVLSASIAGDPSAVQRLLREAQLVNRIEHDGVVKVSDAGRLDDDRPYLVMQFVDGQPLSALIGQGRRRSLAETTRWGADLLDAVAAAHAVGVVHRDLKPSNVMLTRSGRIIVLDFGVAKLLAADSPARLTVTGATIGTPEYMAPEQLRGQAVGPAADLYAVGAILFEMLCGRRPFLDGGPLGVIEGHVHRRPPPPRALRPETPMPLQEIILAALAKDPARRPASAAVMRDAVRAVVAGGGGAGARIDEAALADPALEHMPPALDGPPTVPSRPLQIASDPGAPTEVARRGRPARAAAAPDRAAAAARPDLAPRVEAGRGPNRRGGPTGRRRVVVLAAAIATLAVVATALVWWLRRPEDARPTPPPAAPRPAVVLAPSPVVATTDAAPAVDLSAGALVQVVTVPTGAAVVVNGAPAGRTPYRVVLAPGPHNLEVSLEGREVVTRRLVVGVGETVMLEVELPELPERPARRRPAGRTRARDRQDPGGKAVKLKDPFAERLE